MKRQLMRLFSEDGVTDELRAKWFGAN